MIHIDNSKQSMCKGKYHVWLFKTYASAPSLTHPCCPCKKKQISVHACFILQEGNSLTSQILESWSQYIPSLKVSMPEVTRPSPSPSSRLCPSTAGCSPPSMSSIVVCLLLSLSRWFPPSLLCHLAIFCLVVLSLVATLCSALSTYCPLILLYDQPISTFCFSVYSTISMIFVLFF